MSNYLHGLMRTSVSFSVETKEYLLSVETATKLIELTLGNVTEKLMNLSDEWHPGKAQFLIHLGDQLLLAV